MKAAQDLVDQLSSEQVFRSPIVTKIVPYEAFYPAEAYHREYFKRNTSKPYCQVVIAPKLVKFRAHFRGRLRKPRVTSN
jgi:peptide-methionine (S)-S-oxide reductase